MKIKKSLFAGEMSRLVEEILGPNADPPSVELNFGGFGEHMPQGSAEALAAFMMRFAESAFMAFILDNILIEKGIEIRWGRDAIIGFLESLDKKIQEGFSLNRG